MTQCTDPDGEFTEGRNAPLLAQTVSVVIRAEDGARQAAILGDRGRPLKHVQRAVVILLSAERLPVLVVVHRAGVSRPAVWRWQRRYAEQGPEGLLRDKTRKPGRAPLATAIVAKVLALTCSEPPGVAPHRTGRAIAKTVSISFVAVQRIWQARAIVSSVIVVVSSVKSGGLDNPNPTKDHRGGRPGRSNAVRRGLRSAPQAPAFLDHHSGHDLQRRLESGSHRCSSRSSNLIFSVRR